MKLISGIFLGLLGIAVITLSIGNDAMTVFSLYPLPFEIELPLYMLILGGGFIGLLLGSFRIWMADGKIRRENRAGKQEILRLKGEIARLEKQQATQNEAISSDAEHLLKLTEQKRSSAA